jgi:hypothetical protein
MAADKLMVVAFISLGVQYIAEFAAGLKDVATLSKLRQLFRIGSPLKAVQFPGPVAEIAGPGIAVQADPFRAESSTARMN